MERGWQVATGEVVAVVGMVVVGMMVVVKVAVAGVTAVVETVEVAVDTVWGRGDVVVVVAVVKVVVETVEVPVETVVAVDKVAAAGGEVAVLVGFAARVERVVGRAPTARTMEADSAVEVGVFGARLMTTTLTSVRPHAGLMRARMSSGLTMPALVWYNGISSGLTIQHPPPLHWGLRGAPSPGRLLPRFRLRRLPALPFRPCSRWGSPPRSPPWNWPYPRPCHR